MWKNRYYLSGDFPPFGGWHHHLCHPAKAGALWALGRGDNSGNMVLLSLASPLGEEGHEVAKGCWRVRIGKKLKVE